MLAAVPAVAVVFLAADAAVPALLVAPFLTMVVPVVALDVLLLLLAARAAVVFVGPRVGAALVLAVVAFVALDAAGRAAAAAVAGLAIVGCLTGEDCPCEGFNGESGLPAKPLDGTPKGPRIGDCGRVRELFDFGERIVLGSRMERVGAVSAPAFDLFLGFSMASFSLSVVLSAAIMISLSRLTPLALVALDALAALASAVIVAAPVFATVFLVAAGLFGDFLTATTAGTALVASFIGDLTLMAALPLTSCISRYFCSSSPMFACRIALGIR